MVTDLDPDTEEYRYAVNMAAYRESDAGRYEALRMLAPFPYFGGKSRVAAEVWARFGDVPNYVEPFAGSLAVLLARPHAPGTETVNDADGFIANFWRAAAADPDAVAHHADWPVNETDLHARHAWLVARRDGLTARLEGDPAYYDAHIAGWWLWGICAWIGSGWCSGKGPWSVVDRQLVHLGNAGQGINRQLVHLGNAGQGINRQLVHLGDAGRGINRKRDLGTCDEWSLHLRAMMRDLADRLRRVRVCSGDWSRVVGPSVTDHHGLTAVFLDPPYDNALRTGGLYTEDDGSVAADSRDWAIANGANPLLRIALCGYEHEHGDAMPETWTAYRWKARGGFGSQGQARGRANAASEVVWFSPHCLLRPDVVQTSLPLAVRP